jgi:hypothetical protein
MQPFIEISQIFFTTFALSLVMPIYWIVLFLVYLQYRRIVATEEKLYGRTINKVGRQMLLSVALGASGGFAASAILVFLGLSLEQIGLYFIWPVALLLLLINPRYLCFSYAGGIVAVLVLFFRHLLVPVFPALAENSVVISLLGIHIPALLVLIGLLHLVEAILIYVGGHWGSSPIYLKKESGEVVGAFTLQRFWPIPLVALLVAVVVQVDIVGVSMPEWWPILQSTLQPGEGQSLQYMVVPVAAGLGYADMALSSKPRERGAFSAKLLLLYSIVLLVAAVGAEYFPWLIVPGILIAPIGHELLIIHGKKKEDSRPPLYRQDQSGVALMMVLPDSVASEAGLQADDLILRVNGESVHDNRELMQFVEQSYFMVLIEGTRAGDAFSLILKKRVRDEHEAGVSFQSRLRSHSVYSSLHRSAELGLIPVPATDSAVYLELSKPDPLGRFRRLKEKLLKLVRRQKNEV